MKHNDGFPQILSASLPFPSSRRSIHFSLGKLQYIVGFFLLNAHHVGKLYMDSQQKHFIMGIQRV